VESTCRPGRPFVGYRRYPKGEKLEVATRRTSGKAARKGATCAVSGPWYRYE